MGVNEGEGSAGIVARQPFQDGIAPATSPDRQMSSRQNASSYSHRREKETVVFQSGEPNQGVDNSLAQSVNRYLPL